MAVSADGLLEALAYETFLTTYIKHVDNDYFGLPFELEDWQREMIWNPVFGTGAFVDGRFKRQYRRALLCMPRDYGKTEIAAGMLLTIANMEPVANGEYAIIASSKQQARKGFTKVKAMIKQNEDLRAIWQVNKDVIVNRDTGSQIWVLPYSEEIVQSYHFNVCIMDEMHVYKTDSVYDGVVSGQRDVPNALCIIITTAGDRPAGVLYDLIPKLKADPGAYVWWHHAPRGRRPDDPKVWAEMALPSWVSIEKIADQYASLSIARFTRYVLNDFPERGSENKAIKEAAIKDCSEKSAEFDFDAPFAVGVDGAASRDTFAIVAYQAKGDVDVFREWCWTEAGPDGYYPMMDIADVLEELGKYRPLIAVDPARLLTLYSYMGRERGVDMFALPQTPKVMCAACGLLIQSIERRKAALSDCKVLTSHASNAYAEESKAYGIRFTSKGSGESKERIDAAIAASMAMYAYETQPEVPSWSGGVYSIDL